MFKLRISFAATLMPVSFVNVPGLISSSAFFIDAAAKTMTVSSRTKTAVGLTVANRAVRQAVRRDDARMRIAEAGHRFVMTELTAEKTFATMLDEVGRRLQ